MIGSGVHGVDDLSFILDRPVVEIAAITNGQTPETPLESLATMCLRFSDGTIGMVCCSSRIPDSINDVTIYGSDGRIVLKDAARPSLDGTLEVVSETMNATVPYEPDPLALFQWQAESFNQAIQKDQEPRASGLDGLKSVQVTRAMIESAATGRTIKLEPLPVP